MELIILLAITLNLTIESYSWLIKAIAVIEKTGQTIAISNMILYSSRIFYFTYTISISFYIDLNRGSINHLILFLIISLILAAFIQFRFFSWGGLAIRLIRKTENFISKAQGNNNSSNFKKTAAVSSKVESISILGWTAFSSFIFTSSLIFPYIMAFHNPNTKLAIVSIGGLGNFIATVPLVYHVDYQLHKYMDMGLLEKYISSYFIGRGIGFILSSILIYSITYFIR
jgi:hypothetical protein